MCAITPSITPIVCTYLCLSGGHSFGGVECEQLGDEVLCLERDGVEHRAREVELARPEVKQTGRQADR